MQRGGWHVALLERPDPARSLSLTHITAAYVREVRRTSKHVLDSSLGTTIPGRHLQASPEDSIRQRAVLMAE
jgi:hypothetical protein